MSEFQPQNRKTWLKRIRRNAKLQYWKLMRSPGGGKIVASGFSIGFGLEMILPITLYTAYILMIPLIRNRNLLSASIIGNIFAKITFFPILFIPFGHSLGKFLIFPFLKHLAHHTIWHKIVSYFATIIGLSFCGVLLGLMCYPIVYFLYERNRQRRFARRKSIA
ncbi:DUF2062 domain-containing protein [Fodinisporobacter ferrooxydans]|uniref:DUF2062 domain-containing protein n=1 Tax=Fodinisporobacter ferrooxydans TaxID=2901836 RepID=A0ABY4CHG4_9BACL|nr:DUF2062 domain-containing protein [Alicyclobacillaceae bacterium MYW30-H2]